MRNITDITSFYKTHRYDFNILVYVYDVEKQISTSSGPVNPVKVATFKNVVVVFVALVRTRATKYIGSWIGERALICTGRTWPKLQCWWGNCQARLINYCLFSVWSVATQVDLNWTAISGYLHWNLEQRGGKLEVSFRKAYPGRGYYCFKGNKMDIQTLRVLKKIKKSQIGTLIHAFVRVLRNWDTEIHVENISFLISQVLSYISCPIATSKWTSAGKVGFFVGPPFSDCLHSWIVHLSVSLSDKVLFWLAWTFDKFTVYKYVPK